MQTADRLTPLAHNTDFNATKSSSMHNMPIEQTQNSLSKNDAEPWKAIESMHASKCSDTECLRTGHRKGNVYCKYEKQPVRRQYVRSVNVLPKVNRASVDNLPKRERGASVGAGSTQTGQNKDIETDDYQLRTAVDDIATNTTTPARLSKISAKSKQAFLDASGKGPSIALNASMNKKAGKSMKNVLTNQN